MDNLVRGHPKTSEKSVEYETKVVAPKLCYAVAFGRKIGVFVNKRAKTERLTKPFKRARFTYFENLQMH